MERDVFRAQCWAAPSTPSWPTQEKRPGGHSPPGRLSCQAGITGPGEPVRLDRAGSGLEPAGASRSWPQARRNWRRRRGWRTWPAAHYWPLQARAGEPGWKHRRGDRLLHRPVWRRAGGRRCSRQPVRGAGAVSGVRVIGALIAASLVERCRLPAQCDGAEAAPLSSGLLAAVRLLARWAVAWPAAALLAGAGAAIGIGVGAGGAAAVWSRRGGLAAGVIMATCCGAGDWARWTTHRHRCRRRTISRPTTTRADDLGGVAVACPLPSSTWNGAKAFGRRARLSRNCVSSPDIRFLRSLAATSSIGDSVSGFPEIEIAHGFLLPI